MNKHIIALYSPWPQSGKTTVAEYLERRHSFERLSFATPLKLMLRPLLGHLGLDPHEYLYGEEKGTPIPALRGITSRRLMQTLGTEWGRALAEDFWVDIMAQVVKTSKSPRIVIDDMRFPNEWDLLKTLGAAMIWVHRKAGEPCDMSKHASEGALSKNTFNGLIDNNGTLPALHGAIDMMISPDPATARYYH